MDDGVWILGGYQSDFARNLSKENRDFADLTREVVDGTLTAAKVDAADLAAAGVVHVANAFGEMFARQGHLGAMPATVCDDLWDTPATRHEAACASGSVATLAAMADLRSGAYRVALVVGLELEKTVPGDTAAEHLSAAAWTGHEGAEARYLWPSMFAQVADEYDRRYGLDDTHLRAIAQLNFANARRNPNAQTRGWTIPDPITDDDATNPLTEGRLRRFDCSQMTDGRRGIGPGQRCLSARPSRRAPDRPHRRLGTSHRRVGSAAETGPRRPGRLGPLPTAARAGHSAGRPAPRPGDPRRSGRDRGARLLHPQRIPGHRSHRVDRPRGILEGHRERRDRDRRAATHQPQRRTDRWRTSGRGFRCADAARRGQTGERHCR